MSSSTPNNTPTTVHTPTRSHHNNRNGRQDLNHLLGFYAAPRVVQSTFQAPPRRSTRRAGTGNIFNRERFVNAQMRFVLKPTGDYTAHFADPDIYFDWSDVVQVVVPTSSALSTASASLPLTAHDHSHDHSSSDAAPTCPICLSRPNASRMSRCGHVFCFGCVLHYLALADGTRYRKCPVCYDPIYAKDLKSVKWFDPLSTTPTPSTPQPNRPGHVTMRLIERPPLTTLALPRSSTWPSSAVHPLQTPWLFTPDVLTFAKFMLGAPEYLSTALELDLNELQKEVIELRSWGGTNGTDDELGITFVRAAMVKVKEELTLVEEWAKLATVMGAKKFASKEIKLVEERWEKRATEMRLRTVVRDAGEEYGLDSNGGSTTGTTMTSSSEVEEEVDLPVHFLLSRYTNGLSSTAQPFASLASHSPISTAPTTPTSSTILSPIISIAPTLSTSNSTSSHSSRRKKNINPAPPPESTYYYYQAASGQSIFLDSLDIRILKAHFGSYDLFPDTIEVPVEGLDEGSVTEELRRKYHYLAHLPRAMDVVFIEVDLSSIVDKPALDLHGTALKQRRAKRRDKGRREDKAKAKSEQREVDNRPSFPTVTDTQCSYVSSRPISYTSVPYEGFLESANFPQSIATTSTSILTTTTTEVSTATTSSRTVWGKAETPRRAQAAYEVDDEYDERWEEFEGNYNNYRRGGVGGGGTNNKAGASSGSNSGGGSPATNGNISGGTGGVVGGGKKKKAKKLVLSLTSGRGTG